MRKSQSRWQSAVRLLSLAECICTQRQDLFAGGHYFECALRGTSTEARRLVRCPLEALETTIAIIEVTS